MGEQIEVLADNPALRKRLSVAARPNVLIRLLPAILAFCLFFVAATALTWPRVSQLATSVVDHGDPLQHIWKLDWVGHNLFTNYTRLYDAPIYHGFPLTLAYDEALIGQAISAMALTAFTQNIDASYNLLVVLEFVLAAWCVFLLARHITGSTLGGLFAGMTVGFTSYTFAHLSHLNLLALYPLPLALLCLHQVFDAPRHSRSQGNRLLVACLWAGAFLACSVWQALHSFYYAAYLALASAALVLWEVLIVRRWRSWPRRWRATIAGVLAGAWVLYIAAIWLLSEPNRAVQREFGFRRSLQDQISMSAQLSDYFSVSPRNTTYSKMLPLVSLDQALFPGFVALALGAIGLVLVAVPTRRRRTAARVIEAEKSDETRLEAARPVDALGATELSAPTGPVLRPQPTNPTSEGAVVRSRLLFYVLLTIMGVVLSLGPVWDTGNGTLTLPYQFLWSLPGFEGLRGPRRLGVLALIGWGVLVAWGWRGLSSLARDGASRLIHATPRKISTSESAPASARTPIAEQTMLRGLRVVGVGMAAVLLVVMGAEQWTVPTPSAPVPPPPYFFPEGSVPPAYNWLADQRDNGVVIEFPIQLGVATRGYPIMYYQKIHRHPLINGLSSYQPSLYWDIMSQLDVAQTPISGLKFTPAQIGMLQTLEVRYLLFNQRAYKTRHWEQIEESLALYPQVKFIGQYDIHRIYTLEPLEEGAQPRFGWRAPVTVEMGASMPITVTIVNPYAYQLLTRLEPDLDVIVDWQRKEDGTQASSQNASSGDGEPGRWQPPGALFPIQSIHYSSLLNNPATVRAELTLETEMLVYQGAHLYKTSVSAPSQAGKYLLRLFPKWRLPLYKVAPPTEVLVTTRP